MKSCPAHQENAFLSAAPQHFPNWQGQAVPSLFSLSLEPDALREILTAKRFELQGCCAVRPRQPAAAGLGGAARFLWPGPRPQVHPRIPGAATLLPGFRRAGAATRRRIRNGGETVTRILFARQMQTKTFCFRNHKILWLTKNSLHVP